MRFRDGLTGYGVKHFQYLKRSDSDNNHEWMDKRFNEIRWTRTMDEIPELIGGMYGQVEELQDMLCSLPSNANQLDFLLAANDLYCNNIAYNGINND